MLLLARGDFIQFLVSYQFFYTKTVQAILLTAHWIPRTVFLPYPAYFYSFGHFILGICKAYFGSLLLIVLFLAAWLSCECFN